MFIKTEMTQIRLFLTDLGLHSKSFSLQILDSADSLLDNRQFIVSLTLLVRLPLSLYHSISHLNKVRKYGGCGNHFTDIARVLDLSQRTTKPTIRLVRPAETQISLHIMCLLQPLGYPKMNK